MIPYWHEENLAALARGMDARDYALVMGYYNQQMRVPAGPVISAPDITGEVPVITGSGPAAESGGGLPGQEPAPATTLSRMDAVAEFWAVLGEPLGLGDEQLPAYGVPEPGCCRICLRGPLYIPVRRDPLRTPSLCIYCHALQQLAPGPGSDTAGTRTGTARYRRTARTQVFTAFCAVACFILAILMIVQVLIK